MTLVNVDAMERKHAHDTARAEFCERAADRKEFRAAAGLPPVGGKSHLPFGLTPPPTRCATASQEPPTPRFRLSKEAEDGATSAFCYLASRPHPEPTREAFRANLAKSEIIARWVRHRFSSALQWLGLANPDVEAALAYAGIWKNTTETSTPLPSAPARTNPGGAAQGTPAPSGLRAEPVPVSG